MDRDTHGPVYSVTTRRRFLQGAAVAAVAGRLPGECQVRAGTLAALHPRIDPGSGVSDPQLRVLALRAIDAAKTAGAVYADVRFTADRTQKVVLDGTADPVTEDGKVYVAVRAFVAGGWGFATGPDCTADRVVQLACEAVAQASTSQWPTGTPLQLDAYPPIDTGNWTTPLERDPFQVSADEKLDFLHDCLAIPEQMGLHDVTVLTQLAFRRQEKVFASTTGAYVTQRLTWVGPSALTVTLTNPATQTQSQIVMPVVPLQSGGFERFSSLRAYEHLEQWVEEIHHQRDTMPVPMGKYPLVLDAYTAAALVRSTIGYATELDRVLGDDVNADHTSYLTPDALGRAIAHPMVSVTGGRTQPSGPAAVGWDDDGVVPESFALVANGTLVDFATSRTNAPALDAWYRAHQRPVRSHGCAVANTAADLPIVMPPDLTLHPGKEDIGFEQLVAQVGRGFAVVRGDCDMDRAQQAGQGSGTIYEIHNGKLGRYLGAHAAFLFRTSECWKNVLALGGASSAMLRGFTATKGQPEQTTYHGVWAVPIALRDTVLLNDTAF